MQKQQIPRHVRIVQLRKQVVGQLTHINRQVAHDRLGQSRVVRGDVRRRRLRLVKRELGHTGRDMAPVYQLSFVGLLPVDIGSVAAPRIANEPRTVAPLDDRMHPRTQWIAQHDLAFQSPTDAVLPILPEDEIRARPRAIQKSQVSEHVR